MKLKMKKISGKNCNSSLSIYYKNIQQSTALLVFSPNIGHGKHICGPNLI